METRERNPTKTEREEERKQLFQDYLQFKDQFSERLSNPQKLYAEAKTPEKNKKNVLVGEGNLTLVKLIFLQNLQEKQNCIKPISDFRIIKIKKHQPQIFEKKEESEEITPRIFEKIHLAKENIKEIKNLVFSGKIFFNKIQNFSQGKAKIETIKTQKIEEFVKQFSRNSYSKQNSNENDKIPKNALSEKIAIFNNPSQKNTPNEKNNTDMPKVQKVQTLKEKYEKAINDTNSKTIEKSKINNTTVNIIDSIRNGNNRFSLETITEKNGESCSQIFDGDMAASRKTYGKLSISQQVIKEVDDEIMKIKEDKLNQNMEETKNNGSLKNQNKEKLEISSGSDSKKEEEPLKQQNLGISKNVDSNLSSKKQQQNLIATPPKPKALNKKDFDSSEKNWIKKKVENEETKIKETKNEEEKSIEKLNIKKKEDNKKEKKVELPQGKKAIMEKLMKLPFQNYPGQKVLKTSQTMKETLSHDIDDDYNEVFYFCEMCLN